MSGSLPGRQPTTHGVDRAHALDLDHALALAGQVGRRALLGDRALGVLEPLLRPRSALATVGISSTGRAVKASPPPALADEQLLERGAALGEGQLEQRVVLAREQVEGDVHGGRLDGEALDARDGRVDALAERVEVLAPVGVAHDDLAVEHVAPGGKLSSGK